jgi:hypothetical protein
MEHNPTALVPAVAYRATRADNDEALLASWLDSLGSEHTRRNFETTARKVLAALPHGLRGSPVEDVRAALASVTNGCAPSTAHSTRSGPKPVRVRAPGGIHALQRWRGDPDQEGRPSGQSGQTHHQRD